jgi:outer membrane protein assembly factor BamB
MKKYVPLLCFSTLLMCGLAFVLSQVSGQEKAVPPVTLQNVPNGLDINNQQGPPPKVADPTAFTTKEGKKAWKVVIPGNRPLATPAVVNGKIYIGGGFGSYEFYSFDAKTGKQVWQYRTGDDGPTAAVVSDGYIAFNTESCEIEVVTIDGKRVWKKWLGDPLMSMPAIHQGKLYMAYPDSRGDNKHYLTCFELKTGEEHWKKQIPGDIISAPVIEDGQIYVATLEGTVSCFHEKDGKLVWQDKKNATSSVAVYQGKCYFSNRAPVVIKDKEGKVITQQFEGLAGRDVIVGGETTEIHSTKQVANYLDFAKRQAGSDMDKMNKSLDAGVGFGAAPAAAKLDQAESNLGLGSVAGVWSYQGSRPFLYKGKLVSAMGDVVKCVDPKTEKVLWEQKIKKDGKDKDVVESHVTPPAIVNGKLFLGTTSGEILCMSADNGKLLWKATVGEPIVFQPAVMDGRVYVSTSTGSLFSVETGDAKDTGWSMWGGNASHNGGVE